MALPPGAENPSAAFLAGQKHGAALAQKPKAPAKKVAAPVKKPAARAALDPVAQARALATGDTQAVIAAIQAQQALYGRQAQDRAAQIGLASQAAAKYLGGVGDTTAASYTDAAKTLAGFAQGYSGDLKQTATDAAASQQAQLAGLGAPAAGLKTSTGETVQPASLANVLYGLGGALPANVLVTSGQALAGAQRQLPQATLGYGQQQAAGALAAGQQQADTLTPQILDAQGKLPSLALQYLSAIRSGQTQEFNQKLALAKYGTSVDQFNTRQGLAAAKYKTGVDQFNVKTTLQYKQLDLSATKAARAAFQSDRSYKLALDNLGIRQKAQQVKALADEAKVASGGFTPLQIQAFKGEAAAIAADAFNGNTDLKLKPLNYGQALAEMRKGVQGGHGAIPLSVAIPALQKAGFKIPAAQLKALDRIAGVGQTASPFAVVNAASSFLGIPYSWGGGTPNGPTKGFNQGANITGYDCSSFVQAVMVKAGVTGFPRTTYAQVKQGTPVSLDQLQPGDLIFTRPGKNGPNHVGLYIGGGKVQESPHTGAVNRIVSLPSYLANGFVAARRCIGG